MAHFFLFARYCHKNKKIIQGEWNSNKYQIWKNKTKTNAYSTLTHSVIIPRCVCKYDKAAYYVGSMYFNMIFQKIKNKLAYILA